MRATLNIAVTIDTGKKAQETVVIENWTVAQMSAQGGRIAIVTGANSGIGLETTIALANAGASVVMACRNPDKATSALAEIRRRAPRGNVTPMTLDLASQASVRAFAEAFQREHSRLDLLINNAGIMGVPMSRTVDGYESQMGTNHLGHFTLTGLLIEKLLATPAARIITVGSLGHFRGSDRIVDDLNYERTPYSPFGGYCNSKLANMLFVVELARRLDAKGSTTLSAAAHPGGADTNIKKKSYSLGARIHDAIVEPIARKYLVNTAAGGALPTLYAATAPGVSSNEYYGPGGFMGFKGPVIRARRSRKALDSQLARRLWDASAKLTGVSCLD